MATQNYHVLKNSSVLVPATTADLGSVSQPYGNLYLAGNLTLGGNQATITATSTVVPKIGNIVYANSTTAANPAGGETITLTGSGFLSGAGVYIANTLVPVSTVANANAITFTSPVLAAGNYPLGVINTDGGTATFLTGIVYSNVPIWTTSAGTLGTFQEGNTIANTLAATDGALTITYSVTSGSLPGGLSLGTANGNITGTLSNVTSGSSVTYNFTVGAADPANQIVTRNFSYTVTGDTVSFTSLTSGSKSIGTGSAISNIGISATSAFGRTITYNATCLPTGLSISGANIVGTPTTPGSKTTTVYANTNTKSANVTISFSVSSPFLAATGGTVTTCGSYKIHKFTCSGTFTVTNAPASGANLQYLVVAGGGGGGPQWCGYGGAGGGGGLLQGNANISTSGCLVITVGGGGSATFPYASQGGNSSANGTILSSNIFTYGGGLGGVNAVNQVGSQLNGGSGGSPARCRSGGGKGVYPGSSYVSAPRQGYDGSCGLGHGGGAGGSGACGGPGLAVNITGSCVYYANGGYWGSTGASIQNTGQGGNGTPVLCYHVSGHPGGSGVVIFKYQYQ